MRLSCYLATYVTFDTFYTFHIRMMTSSYSLCSLDAYKTGSPTIRMKCVITVYLFLDRKNAFALSLSIPACLIWTISKLVGVSLPSRVILVDILWSAVLSCTDVSVMPASLPDNITISCLPWTIMCESNYLLIGTCSNSEVGFFP